MSREAQLAWVVVLALFGIAVLAIWGSRSMRKSHEKAQALLAAAFEREILMETLLQGLVAKLYSRRNDMHDPSLQRDAMGEAAQLVHRYCEAWARCRADVLLTDSKAIIDSVMNEVEEADKR